MTRHVVGVTLDNIADLPLPCRRCVYWEVAPHMAATVAEYGEPEFEKEAWVSSVLLEWGSCGRIAYSEQLPVGFVLYGPPTVVPRAGAFPTSPPSADAVLLTAMHVQREFRGGGLGRTLVQEAVRDLTRRGVKAIEAFGDAQPDQDSDQHVCVVPAAFLTAVGFKTVRPHPRWPRLRMELRSGHSWKADVEAALEHLIGEVTVPMATPASRAAPSPVR